MTSFARTILIVDDDDVIREHIGGFFAKRGWNALKASSGETALQMLKDSGWSCNCIILDQRMPEMDGLTFLRTLRKQEPSKTRIAVIVLSAYLSKDAVTESSFREYGSACVFQKPQEVELLEAVAEASIYPTSPERQEEEIEHAISSHEIDQKVKRHEVLIAQYYQTKITEQSSIFHSLKEPLFVVARRWNSWYPSFFDVLGGAYAIVFPTCRRSRRNRAVVVDPGFRFLNILADLGLSVQDIETCIITHNHPDHIGGVFEYIACRNQTGATMSFYCNPSTRRMLGELAQSNVDLHELPNDRREEIMFDYCDIKGKYRSLGVRTFATDHHQIGWDNDSRGLVLSCHSGEKRNHPDSSFRTVILGDSAFDEANPNLDFPAILAGDENTKIAVLHIGSAQLKRRTGGHLYLTGLGRLIYQLADKLEKIQRNKNNKLVVLVSEWGLEHASAEQIERICPGILGFEKSSAIVETIEFLKNRLGDVGYDRMTLLPADIGLMVGMESGMVYLRDPKGQIRKVLAERVKFNPTRQGLEYS